MADEQVIEQPKKKHKKLGVLFDIVIIFVALIALAVAGCLIYQKAYLSPFWVNGQSMYPTLNQKAKLSNGTLIGENGGSVDEGSTMVDYGVMDTHERALKGIKRFDIVVCKYPFDDNSDKIKRVIGLPGETIRFTNTGAGNEHNGDLYVKTDGEFKFVAQPEELNPYVVKGTNYPDEVTLGDNQYYVLGDNRAHSKDSRAVGPISYDNLVGKVVAICAYCEIKRNDQGQLEPTNIYHYAPRFF